MSSLVVIEHKDFENLIKDYDPLRLCFTANSRIMQPRSITACDSWKRTTSDCAIPYRISRANSCCLI